MHCPRQSSLSSPKAAMMRRLFVTFNTSDLIVSPMKCRTSFCSVGFCRVSVRTKSMIATNGAWMSPLDRYLEVAFAETFMVRVPFENRGQGKAKQGTGECLIGLRINRRQWLARPHEWRACAECRGRHLDAPALLRPTQL